MISKVSDEAFKRCRAYQSPLNQYLIAHSVADFKTFATCNSCLGSRGSSLPLPAARGLVDETTELNINVGN